MPKAERITPQSLVVLDEFLLDFRRNPITGLLGGTQNEEQAKSMIMIVLRTALGSVPHEPTQGSQIAMLQFEIMDLVTHELLVSTITEAITYYLPFVDLRGIDILDNTNRPGIGAEVEITITFKLLNSANPPTQVTVPLSRLR
jgi:phage baseplate assembly protein W